MKSHIIASLVGLTPIATSAHAGFTFIDFGPQYTQGTPGMVALTNQFENMGVRFSSLMPNDNVYWDQGSGLGIPYSIYGRKPPRFTFQNSEFAMLIEFVNPVSFASISAFDSGGDTDTVIIEALNAQGVRIDSDSVTSTLSQREILAVQGQGITALTITVTSSSGRGAFIDDLMFLTQP